MTRLRGAGEPSGTRRRRDAGTPARIRSGAEDSRRGNLFAPEIKK